MNVIFEYVATVFDGFIFIMSLFIKVWEISIFVSVFFPLEGEFCS